MQERPNPPRRAASSCRSPPAPQLLLLQAPPGQGVPTSPGLGGGARKEECARSALIPPLSSSEVRGPQPSLQRLRLSNGAEPGPSPSSANHRAPPRRLRTPPRWAARQVPAQKTESATGPEPGKVRTRLCRRAPGERSEDRLDPEEERARRLCETRSLVANPGRLDRVSQQSV
ncbi:uncharacterized protein WM277_007317 [Molossus nigricans]